MEPHRQSPCLHAEVLAFAETLCAGVSARRRGLLRRRIKRRKLLSGYSLLITVMGFLVWLALLIVSTTVNKGASITGVSLVQKSRHSGKS